MNIKKIQTLILLLFVLIFFSFIFGCTNNQNLINDKNKTNIERVNNSIEKTNSQIEEPIPPKHNLIGGDRDKHGCLIAAGYSWNNDKEKCTRSWED